jgi:predicted dehydrogenase
MTKVRVGVIGCGYWGPNLLRNFVEIPDSEVVIAADLSEDRLAHIKSRYPGVIVTTDYHDFFDMNLDAVLVSTPPASHYPIARNCLEHGLHALVEKPIALNSEHIEDLIETAEQRGLVLMTGHTFEYNAAVQMLKELIDSGELGEIHYIDSVRVNLGLFQRDLSVHWDLAPHDISILMYILGRAPLSVSAQGADCIFPGKHDIVYLNLAFPDDILANIRVSWLDPRKVRQTTVVGSRKMVVYDDVEPLEKIKVYDKGVETLPYTDTYGEFHASYRYGDVVVPHIQFVEPLRMECQHFLDCIVNGSTPRSNGYVGLNVVKTLEMAEKSLRNGGRHEQITLPGGRRHERAAV